MAWKYTYIEHKDSVFTVFEANGLIIREVLQYYCSIV